MFGMLVVLKVLSNIFWEISLIGEISLLIALVKNFVPVEVVI